MSSAITRLAIIRLLKETFSAWRADNASRLAAALSYYTIFSLTPLLVIGLAVTAQIYEGRAREEIIAQTSRYLGPEVADAIGFIVENAEQPSSGLIAGAIGVVTLLLGASGVFAQLIGAFDVIWRVQPAADRGLLGTIKDRLLAFGMVLVIGLLFLLTLIASAVIAQANDVAAGLAPTSLDIAPLLNVLFSLLLTTLLFALIFKVLPRVTLRWRDVWIGAAATALLFVVGKELIGFYLGYSDPSTSFGAAGSIIVLLVFVYYAFQIFLLGAEFTKTYAHHFGSQAIVEADVLRYHVVTAEDPTMQAVAATLPAEEVQLTVRSLESSVEDDASRDVKPRSQAHLEKATSERQPHLWFLTVVISFLVGLIVGARRS